VAAGLLSRPSISSLQERRSARNKPAGPSSGAGAEESARLGQPPGTLGSPQSRETSLGQVRPRAGSRMCLMGPIWRRSLAPGAAPGAAKKEWRQARAEILWRERFQARVFAADRRRCGVARGDSMFLGQTEGRAAACALVAEEKRAALAWVKRSVARNRARIPRWGRWPSTRSPLQPGGGRKRHFACGVFGGGASAGEGQEIPAGKGGASRSSLPRLAEVARVAALGADNIRLDHDVVGSPDHQQMFDIVASNNNELALPVEVEGIDGPKPRQPGPSITWQPNPASVDEAENNGQ
jgi:hypothetical protein